MELIKIGIPTRAALIALVVLMSAAPTAQAKRWHDADRGDQGNDNAPRDDRRARNDRGSRNDYAPREYYQQREQPSRSPGISLDSAVAQASREGRVLSADEADGGYRIKVLTPQGRVRVLYFGGGR
jgi:hypothetical protein